jgi:Extensin-like protein C-terminus
VLPTVVRLPRLERRPSLIAVVTRRQALGLGGGAVIGALAGCSIPRLPGPASPAVPRSRASCVARSALAPHDAIAGLPLVYEITGRRNRFWFDPGFFSQLSEWATVLRESGGAEPTQLRTYGSWVAGSGSCSSWHAAGRAFDLAQVRLAGGGAISCRYDQWKNSSDAPSRLREYWRLAAGLHLRFAYVLTYLYDTRHHNHIHIDNGRSGTELSAFSPRSRVQVQAAQAIATHLWQRPVAVTGEWDRATRSTIATILDELDLPTSLGGKESWHGFLTAAIRRRSG